MLLNGSANPLRVELHPSTYYRQIILLTHLLSLLLVLLLAWRQPLLLLLIPLLWLSLRHARNRYREYSHWQWLNCWRDGRIERLQGQGKLVYRLMYTPVILPWIIILPLESGRRRHWLPILPDAMERQQWLAIRRFLRFSLD